MWRSHPPRTVETVMACVGTRQMASSVPFTAPSTASNPRTPDPSAAWTRRSLWSCGPISPWLFACIAHTKLDNKIILFNTNINMHYLHPLTPIINPALTLRCIRREIQIQIPAPPTHHPAQPPTQPYSSPRRKGDLKWRKKGKRRTT